MVVLRAQAALEAVDALAEHAGDHLRLPLVELVAEFLVKLGLGDVEVDALDRVVLRLES